jgi:hypothetical protein
MQTDMAKLIGMFFETIYVNMQKILTGHIIKRHSAVYQKE